MAFGLDPNRPRSLRGQLIGLVAALVIPLIALQVWWSYRESQRVEEAAVAEALALADATAMTVSQFLTQGQAIMTATSSEFGGIVLSGEACAGYVSRLANLFDLGERSVVSHLDSLSKNVVPSGLSNDRAGLLIVLPGTYCRLPSD